MKNHWHLAAHYIRTLHVPAIVCLLWVLAADGQTKMDAKVTKNPKADSTATIDSRLIGVWGLDARGGYEFRADGTFIMEGAMSYRFDAGNGVWHYWQKSMPGAKVAAEYKLSADGKTLSINLKKGKPFTNLKRIK